MLAAMILPSAQATDASTTISMSFSGMCTGNLPDGDVKVVGLGTTDSSCSVDAVLQTDGAPVVGDGSLSQLYVFADGVEAAGLTVTAKVYVNGAADDKLTCTISTGGNSCSDKVDSIPVVEGDRVAVTLTRNGGSLDNSLKNYRVMLGKQ
jgi:hypothetical protein